MAAPSCDDLLAETQRLAGRVEHLERAGAVGPRTGDDRRRQREAGTRAGKRPAAPFATGPPKAEPRTPGRQAGHAQGPHGHRPPPAPERIDETPEAPLPDACPDCGGPVAQTHVDRQYPTDSPRRPGVRQFNVPCGRCRRGGRSWRGRHPWPTSAATAAAASPWGPDAQTAIVLLNKDAGRSHGKVAAAWDTRCGIAGTRGACAQVVLRAGRRGRPA